MFKRIISAFCVSVTLFSWCLIPAHADIVDSGSYIASNFWDFLQGNEFDYNLDFWKNVTGYFVGKECPSSPDSYHHGPKPTFGSSSGGSDENGRFGWATCDYCGKQFKYYSSFSGGSGFGKSDLQQSYDAQVAELPATGYTSSGGLIWTPTVSDLIDSVVNVFGISSGGGAWTLPHTYNEGRYIRTLEVSDSGICFGFVSLVDRTIFSDSISYSAYVSPPLNGVYSLLDGIAYLGTAYSTSSSGIVETELKGSFVATTVGHYVVGGKLPIWNVSVRSSMFKNTGTLYFPTFSVVPDVTLGGDTYNINSRPGVMLGMYGDVNGNAFSNNTLSIVNETNKVYTNPATGQTDTITNWSYDYSTRTYTLTLGGGTTTTVTYGDENVIIKEGDTTYNIYYLINGSGSENPDPGPDVPPTCDHTWTETGRTEPTCTTAGKVTSTCSKCNQTKTETIPATGHSWVVDRTVQTTYDEEGNLLQQGYTIYSCSVCGEQYKDMEGTGPPGQEEEKSIWEKIGDLIGTIAGGFLGLIEAVLGKLLDALVSLAEMLMGKLKTVVETVLSIFDEVPALFGGFLDFLGAIFPFLPPEITIILTFGVIAVVFIGILKAVRR